MSVQRKLKKKNNTTVIHTQPHTYIYIYVCLFLYLEIN